MLSVRLLGAIEFKINDKIIDLPPPELLCCLVRLVASDSPIQIDLPAETSVFAPYLEQIGEMWRLECASDVLLYRASSENLRTLHNLKGEFAPNLEPLNAEFSEWLQKERFDLRRIFLVALLENAAGLEENGRLEEAQKNVLYVQTEQEKLEPRFAGLLGLELAKFHWQRKRILETAEQIEKAKPLLDEHAQLEANVNYAAAFVRLGRLEEAVIALETLPNGDSRGWALLHRANALCFLERFTESIADAESAFLEAKKSEDGFLAMSAKTIIGEALLHQAILNNSEPKEAVISLGQAIGIAEVLSEEASALTLAVLAHSHAIWGAKQKALEMAERAFKRARSAKDSTATIRALISLFAITKIGSFARNALTEARATTHQPLLLRTLLLVAQKDQDSSLALEALELAKTQGVERLIHQAQNLTSKASITKR
jgi:tetratricopeptide (TPR) repeat protein